MTPGSPFAMRRRYGSDVVGQVVPVAPIYRQRLVRVRDDGAMTGEMFGGRGHARVLHALHVRERELGDGFGLRVECAIADDLADAVVEIDTRCKGQIDAMRAQLGGHEPAHRARERESVLRVEVVLVADAPRRRQQRELGTEALHAPAFLVDGDDQRGRCAPRGCRPRAARAARLSR